MLLPACLPVLCPTPTGAAVPLLRCPCCGAPAAVRSVAAVRLPWHLCSGVEGAAGGVPHRGGAAGGRSRGGAAQGRSRGGAAGGVHLTPSLLSVHLTPALLSVDDREDDVARPMVLPQRRRSIHVAKASGGRVENADGNGARYRTVCSSRSVTIMQRILCPRIAQLLKQAPCLEQAPCALEGPILLCYLCHCRRPYRASCSFSSPLAGYVATSRT